MKSPTAITGIINISKDGSARAWIRIGAIVAVETA